MRGPYRVQAHAHPHFELLYIVRGSRVVRIGKRRFRSRGGDLIIFRPGVVHEETAGSKRLSYFVIRFSDQDLQGLKVAFPDTAGFDPVLSIPFKDRFVDLFGRMLEERQQQRADGELLQRAYLVEFVVLLRRALELALSKQTSTRDVRETRLRRAVRRIQENISERLPLEALAKTSLMSVSHFSHLFKAKVGASPTRFQIAERIARAKQLLSETDMAAQEIARDLGYSDPYFFYRQFKQKTGVTTGDYRRRAKRRAR